MPTYKYTGNTTYINSLYNIRVEPGEIIETEYILDDIDGFTRIKDTPTPNTDFSVDYTLNPGEKVEITKDMFKSMLVCTIHKLGTDTTKAYVYIDSQSDKTKNTVDRFSYIILKGLQYRNIQKIIIQADEENTNPIVLRVSFGYNEIL